ncbi:MAG: TonB-dependent receptor plug domain-containing protein [Thermodesulfobacteriota bacterium]
MTTPRHPYFPRSLAPLAVSMILAAPAAQAAEAAKPDALAMYFDESQLVQVATRAPKPITQVAENVTIITAEEIADMRAQSLAEVLSRVAGVMVHRVGADFNGISYTFIQGSREEHVLTLIDGVRLNSAMSGDAVVSHIPLRIIERVEIIKGPASSVWGSSQGGVINIITKATGKAARPSGSVGLEIAEGHSSAYEADLAGKAGRVGYFLYAGRQDSDGIMNNRFYDSGRAYGKLAVDLPSQGLLTFTGSAVDPHFRTGDFDYMTPYFSEDIRDRSHFVTVNYDTPLSDSLHLNLGARHSERTFNDNRSIIAASPEGDPGSLFWYANWREKSQGANALLTWKSDWQQVSLGAEINRSEMGTTTDYGPWAQVNWWAPAVDESRPGYKEVYGLFVNDTMRFGALTLTPGLRYDNHSISGSLLSPSLGATYQLRPDTLLRATAARGFQYPILSYIAGGGIWDSPVPGLKPEKVTSFQAGVENRTLSFLSLKLTGFVHHITDGWVNDANAGTWTNGGSAERKGFEAEAETASWHNLRLAANATYALVTPAEEGTETTTATLTNLILRYRDQAGWKGEVAGQYAWWDATHVYHQSEDLTWNMSIGRTVYSSDWLSCDLYAKVSNLFDGNSYNDKFYPMPGRWLLAGLRMSF